MARKDYPLDYRYAKRNVTEAQYDRLLAKLSRMKVEIRELALNVTRWESVFLGDQDEDEE